ncbi:MAG: hypothetical protein V4618_00455 [Pseudomonadota bacterium]
MSEPLSLDTVAIIESTAPALRNHGVIKDILGDAVDDIVPNARGEAYGLLAAVPKAREASLYAEAA